jgi:hypothetical protein
MVIDGGITPGTPDLICGGVFVQAGAKVASVLNRGAASVSSTSESYETSTCKRPLKPMDPVPEASTSTTVYLIEPPSIPLPRTRTALLGSKVARALPELTIRRDVSTAGGSGTSLVRGELVQLQAIAVGVKREGRIGRLEVGGDIRTSGDGVVSQELLGTVDHLSVAGRVAAEGRHSDAAHVRPAVVAALEGVALRARHGPRLVEVH